jgi:hypothetical protein
MTPSKLISSSSRSRNVMVTPRIGMMKWVGNRITEFMIPVSISIAPPTLAL